MLGFDMTYNRLYGCSFSVSIAQLFTFVITVCFLGNSRNHYFCFSYLFITPIASIYFCFFRTSAYQILICSNTVTKVCPSYSLRKLIAPIITPLSVFARDTLLPNSYFLCSFPFEIQQTSGSCSE